MRIGRAMLWMTVTMMLFNCSSGSAQQESVKCSRDCTKEELECSTKCRFEEDVIDKPEVIGCLRECRIETEECTAECECLGLCERELTGCNESCRSHPFRNEQDREECVKECEYDAEECSEICDE